MILLIFQFRICINSLGQFGNCPARSLRGLRRKYINPKYEGSDIDEYRNRVNECLRKVNNLIKLNYNHDKKEHKNDFIGKSFKGKNFNGTDFTMSLLIAANFEGCSFNRANFLGADTRDMNLSYADLREAAFLTQGQVNSARGNSDTKLPGNLSRPITWI